ncbi:MAG: glycosyltransferase family 4 protein [Proteobacteria bacterium]|nr:glycosyltransferase family 4 protein [Pseudomonadota bacterium]
MPREYLTDSALPGESDERAAPTANKKVIFCEPSIWTLYNFRLNLMKAMRGHGFEVVAAAPEPDVEGKFAALGIRTVVFPASQVGMNPFAELWTVISLWRLFRRERPDLIHQSTQKLVLYCGLAARLAGVPAIVSTINGLGSTLGNPTGIMRVVGPLVLLVSRLALLRPVRVCFQNEYLKEFYLKRKIVKPDQVTIIPGSGVDPEKFFPCPRQDGETRPLRFLMFSRMIWHKGVGEYCRAAETILSGRGPARAVEFIMLGGARPDNSTGVHWEWIANPGTIPGEWLENEAEKGFVRWVPHKEEVLDQIQAADVVVLPSYYSEGVPRCLIEAMACGKAVITTDTPGCRDVVEPGRNGFLVPPRDADALVDAMMRFVDATEIAGKMGAQGRVLFLERFSDEHVVAQTLREYDRAGVHISGLAEASA